MSPEDIVRAEEKFNKSKAVHSIMRHVSETCHVKLEDIYKQFGWDLYKRFGHAYDAFKLIVTSVQPCRQIRTGSNRQRGALGWAWESIGSARPALALSLRCVSLTILLTLHVFVSPLF